MDKLSSAAQFLASNPWFVIFGFVLTILSFPFGVYLYQKQKKLQKPTFYLKTFSIIPSAINKTAPALQILYQGQQIKSLSITRVAFLNKGNAVINKLDVAPREPLRITFDPSLEIFEAKTIYAKNQSSTGFDILNKGSEIEMSFDYLAQEEGAVVQIIHTGYTSKDINIKGNIKGVNNNILKSLETYNSKLEYRFFLLAILGSLLTAFAVGILIGDTMKDLFPEKYAANINNVKETYYIDLMATCTGIIIMGTFARIYRKGVTPPLPKEYKSVIEQPWQI